MKIKIAAAMRGVAVVCLFLILHPGVSWGNANVTLAWDASPDSTVTGYQVYYGVSSGNYSWNINAGPSTQLTLSNLTDGLTYYFAVVAYDSEDDLSLPSNEISEFIPLPVVTLVQAPPATGLSALNQTVSVGTATLLDTLGAVTITPGQTIGAGVVSVGSITQVINPIPSVVTSTISALDTVQLAAESISNFDLGSSDVAAVPASPFLSLAGAYNGLFYQVNAGNAPAISAQTSGFLGNCLVNSNGVFSARLSLGGFNYPLAGAFDLRGDNNEVISRAASNLSDLSVNLHLDMTGQTQEITGVVSNLDHENPWTAQLQAHLSTNASSGPPGCFVVRMVSTSGEPTLSTGANYLRVFNSPNGSVSLFGTLADSSQFSQVVTLSTEGITAVYASLYGGAGLVEGWVNLTGGPPTGELTWIRPATLGSAGSFSNGFTNVVQLMPLATPALNPTLVE